MAAPKNEEVEPRHRVLIVDDEESTRLLIARMLTDELDVEAQLAGTCEQALKLAGNYAYDAILLDLLMPGVGGLGVLAALRAASPNANTPVVIVSIVTDDETVKRCMEGGASAYHVKPVRRAELVSIVRAQLAGRGKPKPPARS
jgi:DNA-binding response OmpR family regulator